MSKFEKISVEQCRKDGVAYKAVKLPIRATKYSAGYDFYSTASFELVPGETIKIPTGIRVVLDNDKFLMVVPRSGLGFKYRLQLDNTVGIIDADYCNSDNEGHIWFKITNDGRKTLRVNQGDAIAQGIILTYHLTEDDNAEGIRNGGFGSTDNKKEDTQE